MTRRLKWLKEVFCAATALAAVAWIPSPLLALDLSLPGLPGSHSVLTPIPGPLGGLCPVCTAPVADVATEVNTDIAATSLTSTTADGWYNPPTSLLGNTQTLFSGINPQNTAQLLPVTQGLPCDSYTPMTTKIAPALAQTYNAAISETQQLTTELQGENFSTIAGNVQAPAELASTQGDGQVGLAIVQELQLMRAQLAALTMVVATDRLHELDATVRAIMPRQGGC